MKDQSKYKRDYSLDIKAGNWVTRRWKFTKIRTRPVKGVMGGIDGVIGILSMLAEVFRFCIWCMERQYAIESRRGSGGLPGMGGLRG